jgi:hypothetical protein
MKYIVEAQAVVRASARNVYAILADYRHGHPRVLPPAFTGLDVLEGGTGAGTVFVVSMKAFGKVRSMRGVVTEPEPGRVLEEAYPDDNGVTRFYVTPISDTECNVKLWSELESADGLKGWIERKMAVPFLTKVYTQELKLIEEVARTG